MSFELDWLKRWNQYSANNIAIADGETNAEFSYSQLFNAACAGACCLEKYGVKKGDRIAVFATNELEYVVLFFAAQRIGAVLVPMNYRLTPREVQHIISDCEPSLIVYQTEFSSIFAQIESSAKKVLFNEFEATRTSEKNLFQEYFLNEEDPCMIIYTSGTTGAPKGAVISSRMIFWNSINTTLRLNINQNDVTVSFLPFFHTGGWNVLTTPFLHRGAKTIFLKKFDTDKILSLCTKNKATILFGVPTTMDMLSRSVLFTKDSVASLRYAIVGGEPMPIELIKKWHEKGVSIRQGYGLTEFGPNVFSLNEQDAIRKIGSIGFANFYTNVRLVNEHGQECKTNEIGELLLNGPMCMTEYWKNQKATQDTIKNDWLYTGDLARTDDEGYFYIVGRKKDMYKSGGENVYPPELEKTLQSFPGIREVAVVGVNDIKWGEVGKAYVVLENDSKITEQDILAHCQKNLAKFKIPKYFRFVPQLPKSESGKILKRKLTEMFPD